MTSTHPIVKAVAPGEEPHMPEFRVQYRSLDDFVVAFTRNISQGTMFVLSDAPLVVGAEVRVLIELPVEGEGPSVPCLGRVSRVPDEPPSGMDLELVDAPITILRSLLVDALTAEAQTGPASTPPEGRILIVDDHPGTRAAIRKALEGKFTDIDEAENGLVGLGKVLSDPPRLILSDVEMPEMDGWQFLRMVRARPKLRSIPFVFLTQLRDDKARLRGYELGVDDYLAKPVQAAELRMRLTGLLVRPSSSPKEPDVLSGDLSHVSLPSLLSFIAHERRSGRLTVVSEANVATLTVHQGDVFTVRLTGAAHGPTPLDRAHRVLGFSKGYFEFAPGETQGENELGVTTVSLLLDHARAVDEQG